MPKWGRKGPFSGTMRGPYEQQKNTHSHTYWVHLRFFGKFLNLRTLWKEAGGNAY